MDRGDIGPVLMGALLVVLGMGAILAVELWVANNDQQKEAQAKQDSYGYYEEQDPDQGTIYVRPRHPIEMPDIFQTAASMNFSSWLQLMVLPLASAGIGYLVSKYSGGKHPPFLFLLLTGILPGYAIFIGWRRIEFDRYG